jgi:hypothetical protein
MRPTSVTVAATGSSAWIPVDYRQAPFNLGIMVDVADAASLTWVVQMTMDNIFDTSITPIAITAPSPLDTGTADEVGNITIPCRAIRLNATISSGSATMTVVQGVR